MKTHPFLFVSLFLCILLASVGGCKRTEEPKKPIVSTTVPTLSSSLETVDKSALPATKELSATPLPDKTGVLSASPETVVPPATPVIPGVPTSVSVMAAKPEDKDVVLVAGFESPQVQKGAPVGWVMDRKKGTPFLKLEKGSEIYCLHMRSNSKSSFGVKRGIRVDIKGFPYLNWRWKAIQLPDGGDVRKTQTDDQAIQLYVAFTPTGFPAALNTPVVGYLWDNEAPKGWTGRSTQIGGGKLRYIVARNNTDQLGQWYTEKRNIYEDYRKLFKDQKGGEPPTLTHGVQFHINSQNTKSEAEGYICDVYFSRK